ncbi:hypothetical protein FBY35_1267 [Streptomyces sp. SLBN-118]|uniref:hypothetical protein n=1 Tax=Streptomyces sp. SLBN-118 TaxID=2768454 RepID=UPI001153A639|nr:hypothetical protein [Streptomyces sp. SLBN-118]TQK50898.1 hypothetical protein FBY35_1267 [Streptomyces sp. SLBN-118]
MAVTGMDCDFVKYAEMYAPCRLQTEWTVDSDRVRIRARQHDREIFSSVVTLAAIPAADSARTA